MNLAKHTQAFLAETLRPLARPFTDCRFVVGVSGGVDSLVLLHILAQLVPHDHLLAAHLNHGWRDTAVLDAQFVAQTAAAWGVACAIETVNVVAQAQERGQSLEEAGRQARYRFFARLAHETNATAVLVAHHADDQAETVLLNLLRGTGLAGLSGMKPASPMPEAPEIVLLRPFLTISRADIETYSQQHGLIPTVALGELSYQSGFQLAPQVIKPDTSALVCASDTIAMGVSKYLQQQSLQHIQVCGIGNTPLLHFLFPNTLSVELGYGTAGTKAAQQLLGQLSHQQPIQQIIIPGQLA